MSTIVQIAGQTHECSFAVKAEIDRLEKLVYVPGMMRCAKCGFVGMHMILRASDGAVGVKADLEPEKCPNGCGPLWRVSERESGNETCDRLEKSILREKSLEAALEPFAEMLNGNENEGGWGPNYYDEQPDDFVVRSVGTIGRDYACITVGHLRAARAALKNS